MITLNNDDLMTLLEIVGEDSLTTDKEIEDAIRKLIHRK